MYVGVGLTHHLYVAGFGPDSESKNTESVNIGRRQGVGNTLFGWCGHSMDGKLEATSTKMIQENVQSWVKWQRQKHIWV